MEEEIRQYIEKIKEFVEHVKGNEEATKQSLIAPLFALLGYTLHDPRECIPQYKVDFGKDRSVKPIDWAFFQNGKPIIFIEAKEAGKKLNGYDEQLGDYFAKSPEVKLGILTNGVMWDFFTDSENKNVMDKTPFIKWDVLNDEKPPIELFLLLHKNKYNSELIKTFALNQQTKNLLVQELSKLLEPSTEFIKLAITNIETKRQTDSVLEAWKPILANALDEWVKQKMLFSIINREKTEPNIAQQKVSSVSKIETTEQELSAFALIQQYLGADLPISYEDTASYFKIHVKDKKTWTFIRLYLDRKNPKIMLALTVDEINENIDTAQFVSTEQSEKGWVSITLNSYSDIEKITALFKISYDKQIKLHS